MRNIILTNLEGRIIGFLAFFCMDELFMVCQVCTADYIIFLDIIKSFIDLYLSMLCEGDDNS